ALERRNGRQIWRVELGAPVRGPVVSANGLIYAAAANGELQALEARTSVRRWRAAGAAAGGRLVIVADKLVYTDVGGVLRSVSAATGRLLWRSADVFSSTGALSAWEGYVYAPTGRGGLSAVDARNGRTLWSAPVGTAPPAIPAVVDGFVYTIANDGAQARATALNARTGGRRWSVLLPATSVSPPAVVSGTLFAGGMDGTLYALAANDCALAVRCGAGRGAGRRGGRRDRTGVHRLARRRNARHRRSRRSRVVDSERGRRECANRSWQRLHERLSLLRPCRGGRELYYLRGPCGYYF
ncbi:MAG: PQQ-binding-like beta-propeller repeat protein, partial [Chloroflexia bacterium]